VHQSPNERNYHVFYGFFAGLTDAERGQPVPLHCILPLGLTPSFPPPLAKYKVDKPENFRYMNKSGCYAVEKIDDKEDFDKMRVLYPPLASTGHSLNPSSYERLP